jgi:UDP-glucose 4-epimerase
VIAIYANNELVKSKLDWNPIYSLDEMMSTAWAWQKVLSSK